MNILKSVKPAVAATTKVTKVVANGVVDGVITYLVVGTLVKSIQGWLAKPPVK